MALEAAEDAVAVDAFAIDVANVVAVAFMFVSCLNTWKIKAQFQLPVPGRH